MTLKALKPTLKAKKRYLAFEIISKDKIKSFFSVSKEIWDKSGFFMGEKGLAKAHIVVLKDLWNEEKQKGMIKVNHDCIDDMKAGLSMIKEIEKTPVIFKTIGASGILKKAKAKYLA